MADTMTEQAPGTGGMTSTGSDPSGMPYLRELLARQSDTTGLTRMGVNVPQVQQQPSQRQQPQQQQGARDFATKGAAQKQSMQNLAATASNLVQTISQKVEQRKQRETQQTVDRFTQSVQGLQQAQGMKQQAQEQSRAAVQRFQQATTPEQKQQAQQDMKQAQQMFQQASQAEQQNRTNLDDMFNGPKGEKHSKLLQKAFGIDDKNANTPERQAAIQSLRKSMGVGQGAASVLSRLPQGMQLSPQAQQQELARKAGVMGQPATQGQQLSAATKVMSEQNKREIADTKSLLEQEKIQNQQGQKTDELVSKLSNFGLTAERDADGAVKRNPDGTVATRNLTWDEVKNNEALAQKYALNKGKIDLMAAQAQSTLVRAQVSQMREQRLRELQKQMMDPQAVGEWAKLVANPASGVTLANVPAGVRGAVVKYAQGQGMAIQKTLSGDEIKRADLANNAQTNLGVALEVLNKRPDLFGPAGWGKSQFEKAVAGGDPDAIRFLAAINLANLPAVGIHGVRGKWALEDLQKLDGNLYLNSQSMREVLNTINNSAGEFGKLGGRRNLNEPKGDKFIFARDAQGKLHKAPEGTALPEGWKLEQPK